MNSKIANYITGDKSTATFPNDNKTKTSSKNSSNFSLLNFGFSPTFFEEINERLLVLERMKMSKKLSAEDSSREKLGDETEGERGGSVVKEQMPKNDKIEQKIQNNPDDVIKIYSDNNIKYIKSRDPLYLFNNNNINKDNNNNNISKDYNDIIVSYFNNKFIEQDTNKLDLLLYNVYSNYNINYFNKYKYNTSLINSNYSHNFEGKQLQFISNKEAKIIHKCFFPGCNRTFLTSGWLKSHLAQHYNEISQSNFCKLFDIIYKKDKGKIYKK